jgi:ABC-type glycerol-3-phosphate transport system permease component
MVVVIALVILTSALGAWAGSRLYMRKNRNPVTGAILGGVVSISPPLLPVFLIFTMFRKRLQPGDKGYFAMHTVTAQSQTLSTEKVNTIATRLKEIHSLLEQQLIDEEEYRKLKSQIISEV